MRDNKKKIFREKRAIEKIMSIWWIFSWVLITLGVIIIVGTVSSKTLEIREIHSETIAKRISSCFPESFEAIYSDEIDFYELCNIEKITEEDFAIKIKILPKQENKEFQEKTISLGALSLFDKCEIKEKAVSAVHYPSCFKESFILDFEKNLFEIYINVASNEKGGRLFQK